MARKEEEERKYFTFTWSLENVSYCAQKKGEKIGSPVFVVDMNDQTKWRLWLYPRGYLHGNYVGIFLERNIDCKGETVLDIDYEIALLSNEGMVLRSSNSSIRSFRKEKIFGFDKFAKRRAVFLEERLAFLPKDVLTIRCKLWKAYGDIAESGQCFARTCIGIEQKSFSWNIEGFEVLETDTKCVHVIESVTMEQNLMSLNLYLDGGLNCDELIHIEVICLDNKIKYSTIQLFLENVIGNKLKCYQDELWFYARGANKVFTLPYSRNVIMAKKDLFLTNGVLRLQCDIAFSTGIASEEITKIRSGNLSAEPNLFNWSDGVEESSVSFQDFTDKFKSLYEVGFLSDVKLKTETDTFPAHKFILSAQSPVFKAMFSNDMKENTSDRVVIEDLSDDTIRSMLLYIYTSDIGDFDWEKACDLYAAADKYEILSLKKKCSVFLKRNLSTTNACHLLLLSDLHQDGDLKSITQNFILEHDKEIINSDVWGLLMETHVELAAESMRLKFQN